MYVLYLEKIFTNNPGFNIVLIIKPFYNNNPIIIENPNNCKKFRFWINTRK